MRIKRSAAPVTAPNQLPEEVIRTTGRGNNFILRLLADCILIQVKQRVALIAESIRGETMQSTIQGDVDEGLHKLAESVLT